MKKGMKVFAVVVSIGLSLTALVGAAALSKTILTSALGRPTKMSCDYYWNSANGFTSIYEINSDLYEDITHGTYKTWGTVTETFVNSNGCTNTYIESTDKNGNSAAILLYDCNTDERSFPNGCVVEVTVPSSGLQLYNNMPEITNAEVVKVYDENPSYVQTQDVCSFFSSAYSTSDYEILQKYGPIRVRVENASVYSLSYDYKNAKLKPDMMNYTIPLYFASMGLTNEESQTIQNRLSDFDSRDENVTVFGYLNYYKKGSTATLQLLVRSVYDIVPAEFRSDYAVVSYVEPEPGYTSNYSLNSIFEGPVLVEHMRSGEIEINYFVSYSGYDMNSIGTYDVDATFTTYYGGYDTSFTIKDLFTITVSDSTAPYITGIQVQNATTDYEVGDSFVKPSVYAIYSDGTNSYVTYYCTFSGYNMNTAGTYTVTVTYEEFTTQYTITVAPSSGSKSVTFSSAITDDTYNTGNYGTRYSNDYQFTYYRTTSYESGVANLLPATCDYGDPYGGSISNVTPFKGIQSISITYYTSSSGASASGKLSYGKNSARGATVEIPYSTSTTTQTFNISGDVSYFKIECGDTRMTIKSFTVTYSNNSSANSYTAANAYDNYYRVNPYKYTGSLVAGSSSMTVPVDGYMSGSTFIVTNYKTYTYYTLEYVQNNPSSASDACMTDPMDVANYYSIFGVAPANYAVKGNNTEINAVKSAFGSSNARLVQYFSKTGGYATAIPNVNASSGYVELDLDIDGNYSTSNRSVGRIVGWTYGINNSKYGYGDYIVCDFTDDHYATFQEFNNLGTFLPKFDAECNVSGLKWSAPKTATIA